MNKAIGLFIAALLVLLGQQPAFGQTFPKLTGHVVDEAGLLDLESESRLSDELGNVERLIGPQIVVVTVVSLGGKAIDDFTLELGNFWGLGDAKRDNGMILLVAPNERRVRIEVGYGLESSFPDELCQIILDETILPQFREGLMQEGIVGGIHRILDRMKALQSEPSNDNDPAASAEEAA